MLSIIYGIFSALAWGSADFIGGLASKRTSPYRILFLGELAGLVPFVVLAIVTGETVPALVDMLWAALASLLGLSGLLFLYRALADGKMSVAAPVSALFAALIPVLFSFVTEGLPSTTTLLGFGFAFVAVWLISRADSANWRFPLQGLRNLRDLRLPLLSGFFFGVYFVTLHKATLNAFFWPLVSARGAGFLAIGLFALLTRQPAMPQRDLWGVGILNGVLDIGGNGFFVLAARTGRLDVAAVLGALYPASTVLLAWIVLKEKITRIQTVGILMAFTAIILFTV